ncbi:hypothetical protein [Amycolatopsis lexingtonensis]|uniref:hypothetical protein n=1 Tax=Amycolatopsis lexingtonensis TaxID=218822 RepID=UPI003F7030D0
MLIATDSHTDPTFRELQLPGDLLAIGTNDTLIVDARVVQPSAGCEGELRWEHITLTRVP